MPVTLQGRDLNTRTFGGKDAINPENPDDNVDDEGTFEGVEISADGLTLALGCESANSVAVFVLPPPNVHSTRR